MKCPYRTKLVREFEQVKDTGGYLVKSETIEYPECYGTECPLHTSYGSYAGMEGCKRAENEVDYDE